MRLVNAVYLSIIAVLLIVIVFRKCDTPEIQKPDFSKYEAKIRIADSITARYQDSLNAAKLIIAGLKRDRAINKQKVEHEKAKIDSLAPDDLLRFRDSIRSKYGL